MCGIGGCVVAPGGRPDRAALERMSAALRHRGPDDAGVAVVDNVGLVHRRLAIVDPTPAGRQPMGDEASGWWLTYNGEVFNHLELRAELPPRRWRGGSDTETILHALGTWGERTPSRCNGLFAFAALDTRGGRLLLVRDRFGVKPLYWARHDRALWFASEIRALLAAGVPAVADVALLRDAVGAGWLNGPGTFVAGVRRLLPGRVLEVPLDGTEVAEHTWYEPADAVDPDLGDRLAGLGRRALLDRLEEELRASVRRRLMADVPLGAMCSGGLDSSLVAAFARDEQPGIRAYNAAVADQPEVDEGPWAQMVAEALDIELRTVRMTGETWRAGLVETAVHNEHPLVHESSVPMAQIAGRARDDGAKVLLSGEGADELFGGYGWLHADAFDAFGGRRRLPARVRRLLRRPPPDTRADGERAYERAVRERAHAAYAHHRGARRRVEAALLGDLRLYLPHLLNRQDKNTMQRSIETRIPFLDPALVHFALNLPLEARVRPERKALLRELGARVLPDAVGRRPKVGFGFDVDRYLSPARPQFLADGQLRETLGIARAAWDEGVAELRGQRLMLAVTAEVLCRALLGGSSVQSIERQLWGS